MGNSIHKFLSVLGRQKKTKNTWQVQEIVDFDEVSYLANNPDVASAVRGGTFSSGAEHYKLHGHTEGRIISPLGRANPFSLPTDSSQAKVARSQIAGVATNSILDSYVKSFPSDQNIIDVFKGEWSSTMPSSSGLISLPGTSALFEDGRITWADTALGGFAGKNILELGPLEGAHSYMLQKAGAKSVVSVEANIRAFMKCLCVKEIFKLHSVQFKLGDFVTYLEETDQKFDAVIASGVLYHMVDPVSVLSKMARVTDKLFLWTHYYDAEFGARHKNIFDAPLKIRLVGFEGMGAKRYYRESLNWQGFCGGSEPFAVWLSKDTIFKTLKNLGFNQIDIHVDDPDHPNGPAFSFCAQRKYSK